MTDEGGVPPSSGVARARERASGVAREENIDGRTRARTRGKIRTRDDDEEDDDDDDGDDGRRRQRRARAQTSSAFGMFARLPTELTLRVLSLLDGCALAACACACKDFDVVIKANEERLWKNALIDLEGASRVREDLVLERGKFASFTWRELYGWRVHTLRTSARMSARELTAKMSKMSEGNTDDAPPSKVPNWSKYDDRIGGNAMIASRFSRQGRLAVIDQNRLFTCDPISRGGIISQIHEITTNALIARTLVWAPRSELLACAFKVDATDVSLCYSKIVLVAPKIAGIRRGIHRTYTNNAELSTHKKMRVSASYEGPPIKNILALPRGVRCRFMNFTPCGTFINFVHEDRMESAMYALDCATTITSLYGPSNGIDGQSPVPPPSEKVVKIVTGSSDVKFSFSPNDRNVALMLSAGESRLISSNSTVPAVSLPKAFDWPKIDESDNDDASDNDLEFEDDDVDDDFESEQIEPDAGGLANDTRGVDGDTEPGGIPIENAFEEDKTESFGKELGEVVSSERLTGFQQWRRNFIAGAKTGAIYFASLFTPETVGMSHEDTANLQSSSQNTVTTAITSSNSGASCRRASSWWTNIPHFRRLTDTVVESCSVQPLARSFCDAEMGRLQWVPPKSGDRDGRGFWIVPTSINNDDIEATDETHLVIAPAPSQKAIERNRIMPFIGSDEDDVVANIEQCILTQVPRVPGRQEATVVAPFCVDGQPGGRHIVWSNTDGVFVRSVRFDLDSNGDWTGPPVLGPTMTVLDTASIPTGSNKWNKAYDEVSVRNYASWNGGASGIPALSVMNQVVKHTVELLQWSPSGERLLILVAVHLAYNGPWTHSAPNRRFYTVHQWVCWDPPRDVRGSDHPSVGTYGTLSFGSRFVAAQSFEKVCREKAENTFCERLQLWGVDERAVAFSVQMPRAVTSGESCSYIVIQQFDPVNYEETRLKSETGELPPLQQTGASTHQLPYYLRYIEDPLEYVCEGTHCSWSPT